MNILGFETSCDETSASIVKDGKLILSNVVATSLKDHQKFGGIVPEIASRKQLELINMVTKQALKTAKVKLNKIDAIAVTSHPGLVGSLLVGISFARALSYSLNKPLFEIDHIAAHLYANFLKTEKTNRIKTKEPQLPAVGLAVSGGHSTLFYIKNFKNFQIMGQTRDDAAGEAYDKVARILNLGYPGGPIVDRLAQQGQNKEIRFPCANLKDSFDFSFSGIKTSVYYYVKNSKDRESIPIKKVAYSFQESLTSALVKKAISACNKKNTKTLLVGGGVAANSRLRLKLSEEAKQYGINVFFPKLNLCMDNAAMIAGIGYHYSKKKETF